MAKISTPESPHFRTPKSRRNSDVLESGLKASTLDFVRQFARCYSASSVLPSALAGFVAN